MHKTWRNERGDRTMHEILDARLEPIYVMYEKSAWGWLKTETHKSKSYALSRWVKVKDKPVWNPQTFKY